MDDLTARQVFILGQGGFARELKTYLERLRPAAQVMLVGDEDQADSISGVEYAQRAMAEDSVSYLGSGQCSIKARMDREVSGRLGGPIVLQAANWSSEIGAGSVIADFVVLGPGCVIGRSVLVNYGASVGHDTRIGDLSVIAPQAAIGGFCQIGSRVYVGAGAMVRERLSIGDDCVIGMGAIVTKSVPAKSLVIGVNQRKPVPAQRKW